MDINLEILKAFIQKNYNLLDEFSILNYDIINSEIAVAYKYDEEPPITIFIGIMEYIGFVYTYTMMKVDERVNQIGIFS